MFYSKERDTNIFSTDTELSFLIEFMTLEFSEI